MKIFKMMLVNAAQKIALCFFAITTSTIVAMALHFDFCDGAGFRCHLPPGSSLVFTSRGTGTGTIFLEEHNFVPTSTPFTVQVLLEAGFAQDLAHRIIEAPYTFCMVHRDDFLLDSIFRTEVKGQTQDRDS